MYILMLLVTCHVLNYAGIIGLGLTLDGLQDYLLSLQMPANIIVN